MGPGVDRGGGREARKIADPFSLNKCDILPFCDLLKNDVKPCFYVFHVHVFFSTSAQYMTLGRFQPTPSPIKHFALSEKLLLNPVPRRAKLFLNHSH